MQVNFKQDLKIVTIDLLLSVKVYQKKIPLISQEDVELIIINF